MRPFRLRLWLPLAAALLLPVLPLAGSIGATAQDRPTLEGLMTRLSRVPGLYARFHEEKHIALLTVPLVNEGTVHFNPPDKLVRHTLRPERSSILVDGQALTVGGPEGVEQIDLRRNPLVGELVHSFLQVLAGDREGLQRTYAMALEPTDDGRWTLTLRPRAARLSRIIQRIRFSGRDVVVDHVEVTESNGDTSVTVFSDVDVGRRYTPSEVRRIFRIPPT